MAVEKYYGFSATVLDMFSAMLIFLLNFTIFSLTLATAMKIYKKFAV